MAVVLLMLSAVISDATSCTGPRTPAEAHALLWGAGTHYQKETRPSTAKALANGDSHPFFAPPDHIYVQVQFFALHSVDSKHQTTSVEAYIRTVWFDERLAFDGSCSTNPNGTNNPSGEFHFPASELANIWTPDVFITNQIEKDDDEVASAFWLRPEGRVWWTRKVVLTLSCTMDFAKFPFDTQKCPLRLQAFQESAIDVVLRFGTPGNNQPVRFNPPASQIGGTVEWSLIDAWASTTENVGSVDSETPLLILFEMKRNSSYYLRYVVLPVILLVMVGWLSFFVQRSAAPARVGMSVFGLGIILNFVGQQLETVAFAAPRELTSHATDPALVHNISSVRVSLVDSCHG